MVFKTFGQTATYTGTILASPTPSASGFRLNDIGTLRPQERIYVEVGGILTETQINTISGNDITVTPALSVAPDVPGQVLSYAQPLYNDMLNQSSDWSVADLTELAATPTAGMRDGTKVTVPGWGKGHLVLGGAATPDGYAVVAANGPGQWWLEIQSTLGYSPDFVDEALSHLLLRVSELEKRLSEAESKISGTCTAYTFSQTVQNVSVGAGAQTNVLIDIEIQGVVFNERDLAVVYCPPTTPTSLIVSKPRWGSSNRLIIPVENRTGSSVNLGGGIWYVHLQKVSN